MERFKPAASGSASVLGPLESGVLNALWEIGDPATVGDVVSRLSDKEHSVHYSSAKTTLNTLVAKGYAKKHSIGRANAFAPTMSKPEFEALVVQGVLGGLMRNYRNPLLAHLAESLARDDASLEEFEQLLREQRRGRPK
ncbi:MAG TPA: BlaI/MecI/CopY family transcriptional regulator [Candidatus Baltobacteraceae bacterium]|jgi:predicted transcriptional regulator|nr:BlaI/MecI/CopY family transcriptional regulator [Candidatus Baltobacteraceae bacterium]